MITSIIIIESYIFLMWDLRKCCSTIQSSLPGHSVLCSDAHDCDRLWHCPLSHSWYWWCSHLLGQSGCGLPPLPSDWMAGWCLYTSPGHMGGLPWSESLSDLPVSDVLLVCDQVLSLPSLRLGCKWAISGGGDLRKGTCSGEGAGEEEQSHWFTREETTPAQYWGSFIWCNKQLYSVTMKCAYI